MTGARRKRVIVFVLGVLSVFGLIITTSLPHIRESRWLDKRMCYVPLPTPGPPEQDPNNKSAASRTLHTDILPDITMDPRQPRPGRSIFFHETSCSADNEISLNSRQACAIESAAKNNPDRDVFVLFTSPRRAMAAEASGFLAALSTYKNVFFRNVDIWEYSHGTLIEEWINENALFTSDYVNFHMSDFMRYLSLSKYRGTYLDMDVIVLRSFDDSLTNFAGAESSEDVAAGIISFDDTYLGRQISELCLRDFMLNFSGEKWGNNGPGVITRVLAKICATSNTTLMTRDRCHGFSVLPPSKCYEVRYWKWEEFFNVYQAQEVLGRLSDSVIAHFWNKFSIKRVVRKGDGSAYDQLAKKYCPAVYGSIVTVF